MIYAVFMAESREYQRVEAFQSKEWRKEMMIRSVAIRYLWDKTHIRFGTITCHDATLKISYHSGAHASKISRRFALL